MQLFIGTKAVYTEPMNRLDYIKLRGWELPSDEDGTDEGFLVEYLDDGAANHPDYAGYISWSPAEVFANACVSNGNFSFGDAVELMKKGNKVARSGWNGSGMFAYYVPASSYPAERGANVQGVFPDDMVPYREYLALKTAQGDVATWAPSTSDALANDWMLVA